MLKRGRYETEEDEKNDVPVERVVKLASCAWVFSRRKISKQMLDGGKRTSCNATNDIIDTCFERKEWENSLLRCSQLEVCFLQTFA